MVGREKQKCIKITSQAPGFDKDIEAVKVAGPDSCTVLYFTLSTRQASLLECIPT